jgi:L-lactate dehydrogenase complex protein LldG
MVEATNGTVDVLDRVRRALGRTGPLGEAPVPPGIPEHVVRLVHTDLGLPELFTKRAEENKMHVTGVSVERLAGEVAAFLRAQDCRKIAMPESALLEKVGLHRGLKAAGLEVRKWGEMTLDEIYDFDCGVTDVYCAVAETGSLVIRSSSQHGRSLSLVPNIYVAILEPKNFVADLVDLFEKMKADGVAEGGGATHIITGPSKTADIEMNLVVGVHGPRVVQVFLLQ